MSQKHGLTLLHCILAAIITPIGLAGAGAIAGEHPIAARTVLLAAIVFPVLIATRITWALGYAAGRRDAEKATSNRQPPGDCS